MSGDHADDVEGRPEATPPADPLGRAMVDYARGDPGTLVYRDGPAVQDGHVEELYFTPPSEWSEETVADLEFLPSAGGPILDVGCGTGRHVRWFRGEGVDAVGIDVSPRAVAAARELGVRDVIVGDMFDLPFPDGRFRAIHCVGTQLGLGGSLAGIGTILDEFDRVTTDDALAVVDNYDPNQLGPNFFGYRPDPRDGVAHRCFHFEYDNPAFATGVRATGRSLHFLLCSPNRLRETAAETTWTVRDVTYTNPDGGHYRALLESL